VKKIMKITGLWNCVRIDYSEYYLGKEEGNQLTESEGHRSTWSKKALVEILVILGFGVKRLIAEDT
jgi:hypothetical protein